MEKRLPCVTVALCLAVQLLAAGRKAEAQVKQGTSVKTLTLGLVFQGPPEPVAERFRPLAQYAGRKLEPTGKTKGAVVVAPSAAQMMK
jgi:hypothetical protein